MPRVTKSVAVTEVSRWNYGVDAWLGMARSLKIAPTPQGAGNTLKKTYVTQKPQGYKLDWLQQGYSWLDKRVIRPSKG